MLGGYSPRSWTADDDTKVNHGHWSLSEYPLITLINWLIGLLIDLLILWFIVLSIILFDLFDLFDLFVDLITDWLIDWFQEAPTTNGHHQRRGVDDPWHQGPRDQDLHRCREDLPSSSHRGGLQAPYEVQAYRPPQGEGVQQLPVAGGSHLLFILTVLVTLVLWISRSILQGNWVEGNFDQGRRN